MAERAQKCPHPRLDNHWAEKTIAEGKHVGSPLATKIVKDAEQKKERILRCG